MTEIVVTGLGIQRTARELGYSTAKIKTTKLTQAKVVNLQNGLTGKVSGLNIKQLTMVFSLIPVLHYVVFVL